MGRFDELSDLDFEELVADLLRADLGLPFRAGTRGRDAGVDVLAVENGRRHVAQCKHYRDSTYPQLLAEAKKEAEKLANWDEAPESYRFATSRRLNHRQRDELAEVLAPWITSPNRVLGDTDLRRLLRKHKGVERRHVKLWLPAVEQLSSLLNAASYERSHALLEETRAALPRYVQTDAFFEAREILHQSGVCVIAGPPGVGKTTLARLLLIEGLEAEFQPYELAPGALADAWNLLALDEAQLFYFDDFLGQTALYEARENDSDLLRLMRRIAGDPRRRFVLTTREYILQQARQLSEALDRESGDEHRFLLTLDTYSRLDKARIFYNHIYFSNEVDATARRSLLADDAYLQVIDHPAYSPRVIEWITGLSGHELTAAEKENYAQFCIDALDAPETLWTHPFESGLGDHERALLFALLGLPRRAHISDLERAFSAACDARGLSLLGNRFVKTLAVLDDSFVSTTQRSSGTYVSPLNPSLVDFLHGYLQASTADAEATVNGAYFLEQVLWLWDALRETAPAPPTSLLGAFSAVIPRAFEAPPCTTEPGETPYASLLRDRLSSVTGRLELIVERCHAAPELLESVRSWLAAEAASWTRGLAESHSVGRDDVRLAKQLVELEIIPGDVVGPGLKHRIRAYSPSVYRWDLLDDLQRALPSSIQEAEWSEERQKLAQFSAEALEDAAGYLDDLDELGQLEGLLETFDLAIDHDEFDWARQAIEDAEADRYDGWEPEYDPDDFRDEYREGGETDADIQDMFERLGE